MTIFDNFEALETKLYAWFRQKQRDLPWRHDRRPYKVWLSEIMLQQTQVSTVISYYLKFLKAFPDIKALAHAPEDQVLALWSGLGYYSRARNLQKTAKIICENHEYKFPDNLKDLIKLPGIGSYTAGAILAFSFEKPSAVIDGNITRVFSRLLAKNYNKKKLEQISLELSKKAGNILLWQEGLMELGAVICAAKNPKCEICPLSLHCQARIKNKTDKYPEVTIKPKRTRLDLVCALIHTKNKIYLEKQSQKGLFQGLYTPPILNKKDALQNLLKKLDIPDRPRDEFISHKRVLSHRDLYIHAKLVIMNQEWIPGQARNDKGSWIPFDKLNQIGLASAFKTLLQKASLISLIFSFSLLTSCSIKSPSIRYLPRTTHLKEFNSVDFAKSLLGKTHAEYDDHQYDKDAPDTVKAIYNASGISLNNASDADDIFDFISQHGKLDRRDGKPGDLVFFHNGTDEKISHVGFVERILPDDTIIFIHHLRGVIIRSRMNLRKPDTQIDKSTQQRINHVLKKSKHRPYTAGELFVAFGRLS